MNKIEIYISQCKITEICTQSEIHIRFFLYEDVQKGYFILCCYKERLSRRRINTTRKLFTIVENFELHLCYDLASVDAEAGYQTAMSPNERKVPQRGRTDEAHRSRGIKGLTTMRLWCKEDAHVQHTSHPHISALLRREIKRAKSRVWHTHLIAQATHTYIR